jgi:hypothetical protein
VIFQPDVFRFFVALRHHGNAAGRYHTQYDDAIALAAMPVAESAVVSAALSRLQMRVGRPLYRGVPFR